MDMKYEILQNNKTEKKELSVCCHADAFLQKSNTTHCCSHCGSPTTVKDFDVLT